MSGHRPSEVLEGTQIGRYRIERRLGAGGMGVVYRAQDTTLGRVVAIKFLPAHLGDEPERRERFLQEARAASKLDHENVGTLHGIEETAEGMPYLVMACYEGSTLAERLRSGPLGTGEALEIAIQTARGLREAHAAGILHRDIKPANLMLTPKGVVKIVDFGLAKLAGDTNLTVPGTVMGTVAYLSPEQARGEATDERADIWALSVVLYEMVTGRTPFVGEDFQSVLRAILTRTPDLGPVRDRALRGLLERAFQQAPRDRFQTMENCWRGWKGCGGVEDSGGGGDDRDMRRSRRKRGDRRRREGKSVVGVGGGGHRCDRGGAAGDAILAGGREVGGRSAV